MKKATRFFCKVIAFSILLGGIAVGQNLNEADGLRMPGDWNSFANSTGMGGDFDLSKVSTGTLRWTTTFQFTGSTSSQGFKFTNTGFGDPWKNQWGSVTNISMNTITSVGYSSDFSASNNTITATQNNWYTVNFADNGYTTTEFIFLETSAEPIDLSAISIDSTASDSFRVSITLSGVKSSEERIYVRYSGDSFSTSKHVLATGSGTSYSAMIPATSDQIFYVLTTTVDLGSDHTTYADDYDMITIKLNNNSSSNYTYSYGYDVEIEGNAGWRLLSMPITGGTIDNLTDDTAIQGITSGDNETADANFFFYDSTGTYQQPSNVSTAWGDGYGFGLYFFDNTTAGSSELPITLDAVGSEPSSDVTVKLNKTTTSGELNHYFTLVGNPFASNYDLNAMTVDGDGLQDNVHFWNDADDTYETGDRAAGSYIVAPWQGFWVEVANSSTSTTTTFPTSGKTTSDTTATYFAKTVANRGDIKFELSSETTTDKAIRLAFRDYATLDFDRADATKMTPLVATYSTLAFASNGILKSVESLPYTLNEAVTVNLEQELVGVNGEFTLAWSGLETIPSDWTVTLYDYETGASVDLRTAGKYTFTAGAAGKAKDNALTILAGPSPVEIQASGSSRFSIVIDPAIINSNEEVATPQAFSLEQNYPNPFNPSTTIEYSVDKAGAVNLSVYNLMGQKVAELVNEAKSAGNYKVQWNAASSASGMYYYRLDANGVSITRKMTLIK